MSPTCGTRRTGNLRASMTTASHSLIPANRVQSACTMPTAAACKKFFHKTRLETASPTATGTGAILSAKVLCAETSSGWVGSSIQNGFMPLSARQASIACSSGQA